MRKLHEKKFIILFLVIAVACSIALCAFLLWNEQRISIIDVNNAQAISKEDGLLYNVETADYKPDTYAGDMLTIRGYCFIQGRETSPVSIYVLLMDIETKKCYQLPTTVQTREDVTSFYNDGTNYDNSGYYVFVNAARLKLDRKRYEIKILYTIENDTFLVSTGQLLGEKLEEKN